MKIAFCTFVAVVFNLASFATWRRRSRPRGEGCHRPVHPIAGRGNQRHEALTRETSAPFDFDGLRETDIAVLYWIAKDNDTTAHLAVFEKNRKSWNLTHHVRLGGRGLRHITGVSFSERRIDIDCLEFEGGEPLSSPSLRVKITATFQKGLLHLERSLKKD